MILCNLNMELMKKRGLSLFNYCNYFLMWYMKNILL